MDEDAEEYKKPAVGIVEEKLYESEGSSSEEEDEDDEDEDYLQKLDDHFRQKVIENHHPELKTLNYEEIETLATVVRDADATIIDPLHRTLPVLTRYEKARVLGERAKQINMGAKPFVDVDESMIDGYLIALKELEQKAIPFIIQRPLPHGGSEYWRISDLEVLA
jgi:DNA-directed RNA polymerase I, II, and III subunit RPABC2